MEGQGKVTGYMSICLCFKIHDQICKLRHSGYLNIGTQIQAQWNIFKSSGDQPLCWRSILEQIQIKGPYLDQRLPQHESLYPMGLPARNNGMAGTFLL